MREKEALSRVDKQTPPAASPRADCDYLKWACDHQLSQVSVSEGHILELRKRASVIAGVVLALVSFSVPLLSPFDLLGCAMLLAPVLVTGLPWWRTQAVRSAFDYDPEQLSDRLSVGDTALQLHNTLTHLTELVDKTQEQVGKIGLLCRRTQLVGGYSVLVILVALLTGLLREDLLRNFLGVTGLVMLFTLATRTTSDDREETEQAAEGAETSEAVHEDRGHKTAEEVEHFGQEEAD